MAEETQIAACNGDTEPEALQITQIIDQMDTSLVCKTCEEKPLVTSVNKEVSADNVDTSHLENNKEKPEEDLEEHPKEHESIHQQDSEILTSHIADSCSFEEHDSEGDMRGRIEAKAGNVLSDDSPHQEELPEQEPESEDTSLSKDRKHTTDTREETLTETEEENTSIETDNDNGQGSCDEHENGSKPFQADPEQPVSGNWPDISRHSYSRYDTVSYRKIRKGNTKQRIDEFESMMN
ncbi:ermin [Gastrophryne carolinensis]